MHLHGAEAIASHFCQTGNTLRYLDLCNCHLACNDLHVICTHLKAYANQLEEFYLSGNEIEGYGVAG